MFTPPTEKEFKSKEYSQLLTELFNQGTDSQNQEILKGIRKETKGFLDIRTSTITASDFKSCISGLCAGNLLSEEKKSALQELDENTEVMAEVSSLLTSRLQNLERWDWPARSCQSLEIRRGLAAEWKGFLDEDVLTALFLQYIGVQWGVYLKRQFRRIYESSIWRKAQDADRMSIEGHRSEFHQQEFLSGLPDSFASQGIQPILEYVKAEGNSERFGSNSHLLCGNLQTRSRSYREHNTLTFMPPPLPAPPKRPIIGFKQAFLHFLSTEIRLNQTIHPDTPLLVVQADIESFTSTIIHEAILTTLGHFKVSSTWLDFFKKFLQPEIQGESGGRNRVRRAASSCPTSFPTSLQKS